MYCQYKPNNNVPRYKKNDFHACYCYVYALCKSKVGREGV